MAAHPARVQARPGPGLGERHPVRAPLRQPVPPRPAARPPSAAYTRDFNEIKAIGSATSTTRTPSQTTIAELWTITGTQLWNQAVQQFAVSPAVLGPAVTARDFAMLDLAGADAFIASWDAKYTYNQWRPVTAIQLADTDGNPDTTADPAWTPLITTPNFPDYLSGHATYGGAAETVLSALLGTHPGSFTFTNHANGLTWTYSSFADAATQVVNRIRSPERTGDIAASSTDSALGSLRSLGQQPRGVIASPHGCANSHFGQLTCSGL